MSCDRFEDLIPNYVEGKLHQSQHLENHLKECPSCKQKVAEFRQVRHAFSQWTDEPVPAWNRAPIGFFNQKRPSWLLRWAPLAVASVLFGFVLFNLEITIRQEGTTIRFSKTEKQSELPDDFLEKLSERDKKYQSSIENLLQNYQSQQEIQVKNILKTALDENQTQVTRGLKAMNENWQTQRDVDNRYWGQQISGVYRNTTTNNNHLNLIANHIRQSE